MKYGFDNDKYISIQSQHIQERIAQFSGKLYLELGGKLFDDHHASRVLPGFQPDSKLRMFQQLSSSAEIIIVISALDIEKNKVRQDLGITYDEDVLRLRTEFQKRGFLVSGVVITHFNGQSSAAIYRRRLEHIGIRAYYHYNIEGYPNNVQLIDSEEGFGRNDYVETTRPLVIVTAPGPGSGKMAVCLSQLYQEHKRGIKAGYAKFETFPIWNLPLKHPVNIAYETATADLADVNMIDPFHMEAYGKSTTNYNRDVAAFPLLRAIWERITNSPCPYKSPTDMGVNCCGFGIVDDDVVREASCQEIIRRYFRAATEYAVGASEKGPVERIELLMSDLHLKPEDRKVVVPAREAAEDGRRRGKGFQGIFTGAAIELADGTIVTGSNSATMHAASGAVLNAIKRLAGIPGKLHLLPPEVIRQIVYLKSDILHENEHSLNLDELLVALSMSASANPAAEAAMAQLPALRDCEMHLTHIVAPGDDSGLRRLGLRPTSDPKFRTASLLS